MIDGGLLETWDSDVVAATGLFDQGDLVERPPFFYSAVPSKGVWGTTRLMIDDVEDSEDIVIELEPEDRPRYGIITSQGCDVDEASRKPWIQVAPVFPLAAYATDEKWIAEIKRDSVPHLVLLDPPDAEGDWVADLRIEMPIEKSWLVGRAPVPGFRDDDQRRRFSRRLAGRLERPALPDVVHRAVVRPLRRWLDKRGASLRDAMTQAGIEFRLLSSVRDGVVTCRLLVVGRRAPVPTEVSTALDAWWNSRDAQDPDEAVLLPCRYGTSDDFSMREYLASDLIDDRFLGLETVVA